MSRTDADLRRREQGMIIKRIVKKSEPVDDYYNEVPQEGCQYYGNEGLMAVKCLHCIRKECY
uniref:Uncharacterized protein n=1 Tax=viral metagenome TaxID=1070528 RepID=A0A6M3XR55_9ZZZZ